MSVDGSSQSSFRDFVDGLSSPACYVTGNRIIMNRAARELLGFQSQDQEYELDDWFTSVFGDFADHARSLYALQRSLGLSQPITLPVTNPNGGRFWAQVSFQVSGAEEVWFITDMGSGVHTWNRLRGAEARWQALVEGLPGWVTQVAPDGTITWISHTPDGRPREEVVGHNVLESLRLKHFEQAEQLLSELLRDPHPVRLETDEVLPDGRHVFHEHHLGPLLDGNRCIGFVVHSVDVTERHQREQLMREQEWQLMQARKMEALGRMAGGVAHDLNNLLAVISGNLQLLAAVAGSDDRVQESLQELQEAVGEATHLIKNLLALSRGQKLNPVVADLGEVLRSLTRLLRSQVGRGVTLAVEVETNVPKVVVDVSQMIQVITNLVLNARDAVGQRGEIKVSLERLDLETDMPTGQGVVPVGTYAVVHVADTGCGMDQETQEHLFEPFYTTKKEGTGLGLAVVYSVVQQSGGYIWFETELGKGTTFHVALPAAE
ncbi:MAG: ATP-binding protein [Thermoleophilia bacterium]|nr:ATP-binding protein [Thermoleophilia bacterium]